MHSLATSARAIASWLHTTLHVSLVYTPTAVRQLGECLWGREFDEHSPKGRSKGLFFSSLLAQHQISSPWATGYFAHCTQLFLLTLWGFTKLLISFCFNWPKQENQKELQITTYFPERQDKRATENHPQMSENRRLLDQIIDRTYLKALNRHCHAGTRFNASWYFHAFLRKDFLSDGMVLEHFAPKSAGRHNIKADMVVGVVLFFPRSFKYAFTNYFWPWAWCLCQLQQTHGQRQSYACLRMASLSSSAHTRDGACLLPPAGEHARICLKMVQCMWQWYLEIHCCKNHHTLSTVWVLNLKEEDFKTSLAVLQSAFWCTGTRISLNYGNHCNCDVRSFYCEMQQYFWYGALLGQTLALLSFSSALCFPFFQWPMLQMN